MNWYDIFLSAEFEMELLAVEFMFLWLERRRSCFPIRCLITLISCVGVTTLILLIAPYDNSSAPALWSAVLRFFLDLVATLIGMGFCFQVPLRKIFYAGIISYAIQHMSYAISEVLLTGYDLLHGRTQLSVPPPHELMLRKGVSIAVFAIAALLAERFFLRKIRRESEYLRDQQIMFLGSGILIVALILSNLCYNLDSQTVIIYRFLCAFCCFMTLIVLKEQGRRQQLETELRCIQQQNEMQVNYYEMLKENIELTNIRCHDFKHQLVALRAGQVRGGEISDILKRIEESINIYDSIAKTGNEAMDTVLAEKALFCQKHQIRFTYMVDSEKLRMIENQDIYALFGNALDNSIEAIQQIPDLAHRVISLTAVCKGPFLNIQISNYYEGTLYVTDGIPRTTKADQRAHGYGMKSIQMIVEKYGGEMLVSAENQVFDLSIVIPIVS